MLGSYRRPGPLSSRQPPDCGGVPPEPRSRRTTAMTPAMPTAASARRRRAMSGTLDGSGPSDGGSRPQQSDAEHRRQGHTGPTPTGLLWPLAATHGRLCAPLRLPFPRSAASHRLAQRGARRNRTFDLTLIRARLIMLSPLVSAASRRGPLHSPHARPGEQQPQRLSSGHEPASVLTMMSSRVPARTRSSSALASTSSPSIAPM